MSEQQKESVGTLKSGTYILNDDIPSKMAQYEDYKRWERENPDFFHKLPYRSDQIVCASEEEEFFYESTKSAVPEGEPIGIDVDKGNNVELVLFKGIYWSPQE